MRDFPPAADLQFLIGKELESITLCCWSFHLLFDAGRITVEGDLEHVDSAGAVHRHNTDADRLGPLYVHHLIGQKVESVSVEPRCLTLAFNRGDILRVFSEEGPFEDGNITDAEGRTIYF
ncbi:MAG: hypothetical protein C0500_03200 [Sphingobium sp.]|nr:hypothetical protein [Sphingobium sp.]